MSLIYRSIKGSKLTSDEVDGNFQYLESLVGGDGNKIVFENGFSLVDQNITFAEDWVWNILNIQHTNSAEVVINIPFAASGKQRIDLIVANQSNTFERIVGVESISNPVAPSVPLNKISVTFITVTDGVVGEPTNPIIGSDFVKKSFADYLISNVSGEETSIALDASGKTEIRLTNDELESIASVNILSFSSAVSPELPYSGKPYLIRNLTGNPITILHDAPIDVPGSQRPRIFAFSLKHATDLVVPNNEAVLFHWTNGFMVEIFRSWSEKPYKVYTALLSQSGTNAPTAVVLEDTIGDVVFLYKSPGVYQIPYTFFADKNMTLSNTIIFFNNNLSDSTMVCVLFDDGDGPILEIYTSIITGPNNGLLMNAPIEIRVYN
jgi:hypothetical protein